MDSLPADDPLIQSAAEYVRSYMSHYDASHSIDHIDRVVRLTQHILGQLPASSPPVDRRVVLLSALLHDVGDRKYLQPGDDPSTMVAAVLRGMGAPADLADRVQAVCLGVSYSGEVADPALAAARLAAHPELAVVQDADRLDALGAVGLGRMFTYGGARTSRSMAKSVAHIDEKLLRLQAMAKTEPGRRMARERTERLRAFKEWWIEETSVNTR